MKSHIIVLISEVPVGMRICIERVRGNATVSSFQSIPLGRTSPQPSVEEITKSLESRQASGLAVVRHDMRSQTSLGNSMTSRCPSRCTARASDHRDRTHRRAGGGCGWPPTLRDRLKDKTMPSPNVLLGRGTPLPPSQRFGRLNREERRQAPPR